MQCEHFPSFLLSAVRFGVTLLWLLGKPQFGKVCALCYCVNAKKEKMLFQNKFTSSVCYYCVCCLETLSLWILVFHSLI